MKLFLGLDPSLTSTGYCVLDEHGATLWLGRFPICKAKGASRLFELEAHLDKALENLDGIPTLVAIEGYAFGAFAGRERLGEWGGVLRLNLFKKHIPFIEIPPTTLKKYVTGKGNAKKNQMLLSVYKKWGTSCKTDDEADSYALAQFIRTGQKLKPNKE